MTRSPEFEQGVSGGNAAGRPEQLGLFAAAAPKPFYFVVMDPRTGQPVAAVEVVDSDWCEAEKWCYLAAKEHRETGSVDRTARAYCLFSALTGRYRMLSDRA